MYLVFYEFILFNKFLVLFYLIKNSEGWELCIRDDNDTNIEFMKRSATEEESTAYFILFSTTVEK